MKFCLVIPTLNAGGHLPRLLPAIAAQTVKPDRFLVIDSASTDETQDAFRAAGAEIHQIERSQFDHGGTRQLALSLLPEADLFLYLTQDAIPASPDAFARLLGRFEDPGIAAAFGRQLPREEAGPIERHARLFSYRPESARRTMADAEQIGIRAAFLSNSFAAYRRSGLEAVGGFPHRTIFGEDMHVAARLLMAGQAVAYAADAAVIHSHGYSIIEEFRRYFDVGVLHGRTDFLTERFGRTSGEGLKFVTSELGYLGREAPHLIPSAMIRTLAKWSAYKLGRAERKLPLGWKKRFSMQPRFWLREAAEAAGMMAGANPGKMAGGPGGEPSALVQRSER